MAVMPLTTPHQPLVLQDPIAELLDRAVSNGSLYEREIEQLLARLPSPPTAAQRGALLQALAESGAVILEGIPSGALARRLWAQLLYWKKVSALGLLAGALLWHEWLLSVQTPPLPAP